MLLWCRFECNRCCQLFYLLKHYIRMKLSSQMGLFYRCLCADMFTNRIFLIFLPLLPHCGPACVMCRAGSAPLQPSRSSPTTRLYPSLDPAARCCCQTPQLMALLLSSPSVRSWGLRIGGELTRYGDEGSGIMPVKKFVVLERGLNGK